LIERVLMCRFVQENYRHRYCTTMLNVVNSPGPV
jgi:hypothetical protein